MSSKLISALFGGACAVIIFESVLSTRSHAQGNLAPPAGPAPSMVSLAELAARIDSVNSRFDTRFPGGRNLALASSNGIVSAWDHQTEAWIDFNLGGVIGPFTESNGNFLFINNFGSAAAWSSTSKTWTAVNYPGASITQATSSNGNFYLSTNSGTVAAWNRFSQAWTSLLIGGVINGNASSEGNYLYTSSNGVAAVYNEWTGVWTTRPFNAFLIPIGSD